MCKLWRGTFSKQQQMSSFTRENTDQNEQRNTEVTPCYQQTTTTISYIERIPYNTDQRQQEENTYRKSIENRKELCCHFTCTKIRSTGCTFFYEENYQYDSIRICMCRPGKQLRATCCQPGQQNHIRTTVSQAEQQQQTNRTTIFNTRQQKEVSRAISKIQRTNCQRSCAYYHSLTINSKYCRYFRQNIYYIDGTNGTAPSSVDSRKSRCKENSAQNDYINQRATRRFDGIANTVILLCIVYQLVMIAFQQSHSFTRNTLNIMVCAIVVLMLAVTIFVYKYGSITRLLMTWCEYHYIHNSNSSGYRTMADTRQDESQSDTRKRDASLPIDRLGESNPSKSPVTFENEDIEDSIANDISDPCNQDKRTGCMYPGGIKIVHWNCQGANGKLAAIKDVIQKDGIHILLLQDTRLARRNDGLSKLRLDGYSTYDTPKSEKSHGMIILVHKDIPSDLLEPQVQFGPDTESLSIRIWIRKSSYLIHNIYNIGNFINLSAASLNEKSLFLGDFNAHHKAWCRAAQNRAGMNISDQLDAMDQYVMMNMEHDEYVPTTTYNTTIDLSIIHKDIAAKVTWSIYDGLSSDHFPIIIAWHPGSLPKKNTPQQKFRMNEADCDAFQEVTTAELADFQNHDDLNEFNTQFSEVLTKAAEQSIPKSSPTVTVKMYWRYDLGVKCAKQDYNRANRRYRKHRTDDNKKEMVDKFETYKEMCKYVQERSWRQWVEECNFDISTTELWRRLRVCTGVSQRPPTHPNPANKAEQLCQQFVMRSDPLTLYDPGGGGL